MNLRVCVVLKLFIYFCHLNFVKEPMKSVFLKIFVFFLIFAASAIIPFCIDISISGNTPPVMEDALSAAQNNAILNDFMKQKSYEIDSLVNHKYKRYGFNGNILVGFKGEIVYQTAIGYSNFAEKQKLSENSIYQLASVSKQFTAMGIMILKERNLLSYNDPVTKYIQNFPYPDITIKMLLNHTSGLPNYMWLVEHKWEGDHFPYNDEIIDMMNEHKLSLYFRPGTRYDYSNTGYIILASIVEEVSQQRFDHFIQKNIFEPLKMNNSYVYSTSYDKNKDLVTGYLHYGRRYRSVPPTVNDGAVGDKGVCSTTRDLFLWDQALYTEQLISRKTLEEAFEPLLLRGKYKIPYGFGFRIKEEDNNKLVYHYGRWNGFRTGIHRYLNDSATIIVLNNTSYSGTGQIMRELRKVLHSEVRDYNLKAEKSTEEETLDKGTIADNDAVSYK